MMGLCRVNRSRIFTQGSLVVSQDRRIRGRSASSPNRCLLFLGPARVDNQSGTKKERWVDQSKAGLGTQCQVCHLQRFEIYNVGAKTISCQGTGSIMRSRSCGWRPVPPTSCPRDIAHCAPSAKENLNGPGVWQRVQSREMTEPKALTDQGKPAPIFHTCEGKQLHTSEGQNRKFWQQHGDFPWITTPKTPPGNFRAGPSQGSPSPIAPLAPTLNHRVVLDSSSATLSSLYLTVAATLDSPSLNPPQLFMCHTKSDLVLLPRVDATGESARGE